jgi:serine/threonine-protein kinase
MSKFELPPHKKEMVLKWDTKLNTLFNGAIPNDAEWTDPMDIAQVLEVMRGSDVHMFLPAGGGEELQSSRSTADGLIEWSGDTDSIDNYAFVVKPLKLTFWNPGTQTHEANFVLEVAALRAGCPSSVLNDAGVEECVELWEGYYAPRSVWDNSEYQGKELPATARLVNRATKPARFALFSKGSLYNSHRDQHFDAYSAYHNDPASFRKIVSEMATIEIA